VRFIVDEDVPKSASDFLIDRGHETTHVHDVLLPGSADYLIARWAHENVATVVTCNLKHFRPLLRRPHYARSGLLGLPDQAIAHDRLQQFIDVVEVEEALTGEGRIWVEVRASTVLIGR